MSDKEGAVLKRVELQDLRTKIGVLSLCFRNFVGTSVRRSSRSVFGRSTGNDVSGH